MRFKALTIAVVPQVNILATAPAANDVDDTDVAAGPTRGIFMLGIGVSMYHPHCMVLHLIFSCGGASYML